MDDIAKAKAETMAGEEARCVSVSHPKLPEPMLQHRKKAREERKKRLDEQARATIPARSPPPRSGAPDMIPLTFPSCSSKGSPKGKAESKQQPAAVDTVAVSVEAAEKSEVKKLTPAERRIVERQIMQDMESALPNYKPGNWLSQKYTAC